MVALISSQNLGLSLGSASVLGSRGVWGQAATGRYGEQGFVNLSTGNLVLQRQDELLASKGRDTAVLRTYNSLGRMNDDNGDNWLMFSAPQRLVLSGVAGAAGSTLTRVAEDGAEALFRWDAARA